LLTSDTSAAAIRAAALATHTITVALDYAAGVPTAGTEHLIHTANGVRPVTSSLKWLAAAVFTAALIGGGGVGVYVASAQEKGKPAETKKPGEEKKPASDRPKADTPADPKVETGASPKTADEVQKALKAVVTIPEDDATLGDHLQILAEQYGLTFRIDTAAFRRSGWQQYPEFENPADALRKKVTVKGLKRVPLEDALREILAQVYVNPEGRVQMLSYRIKGSQILIVPEYQPTTLPGSGVTGEPMVTTTTSSLIEQMYGEPVTVRYKNKLLTDVIDDLQDRTGANIVLNLKAIPQVDQATVSATFNDTPPADRAEDRR
jgi:hypothetical protein